MRDFVLEVVLVEQRSLQQVEVALDRALLPRVADAQHVLLPGRGVEADVLRELEQLVLALRCSRARRGAARSSGWRSRRASSATIASPK